jgi:cyclase
VLKKRIIPVQLLLDGRLVKTVGFGKWRDVGDPVKSSEIFNSQYADELIFLNISRDSRTVQRLAELIDNLSRVCFMPIAMGGGINSAEDAAYLILNGADKVVINSAAYSSPRVMEATAQRFGSQAVVVGIDVRWDDSLGDYRLFSDCGRKPQAMALGEHIRRCIEAGAGEIFIQSIDRDGTMTGFDVELVRRTMAASPLPVIAAGGCGHYEHLKSLFLETGVTAAACGSLFNFTDSNPLRAKSFLSNYGIPFKVV